MASENDLPDPDLPDLPDPAACWARAGDERTGDESEATGGCVKIASKEDAQLLQSRQDAIFGGLGTATGKPGNCVDADAMLKRILQAKKPANASVTTRVKFAAPNNGTKAAAARPCGSQNIHLKGILTKTKADFFVSELAADELSSLTESNSDRHRLSKLLRDKSICTALTPSIQVLVGAVSRQ